MGRGIMRRDKARTYDMVKKEKGKKVYTFKINK